MSPFLACSPLRIISGRTSGERGRDILKRREECGRGGGCGGALTAEAPLQENFQRISVIKPSQASHCFPRSFVFRCCSLSFPPRLFCSLPLWAPTFLAGRAAVGPEVAPSLRCAPTTRRSCDDSQARLISLSSRSSGSNPTVGIQSVPRNVVHTHTHARCCVSLDPNTQTSHSFMFRCTCG